MDEISKQEMPDVPMVEEPTQSVALPSQEIPKMPMVEEIPQSVELYAEMRLSVGQFRAGGPGEAKLRSGLGPSLERMPQGPPYREEHDVDVQGARILGAEAVKLKTHCPGHNLPVGLVNFLPAGLVNFLPAGLVDFLPVELVNPKSRIEEESDQNTDEIQCDPDEKVQFELHVQGDQLQISRDVRTE